MLLLPIVEQKIRYLGSAAAMLFVPKIAADFGPGTQFKVSGLLALIWLSIWYKVGSDQPPENNINNGKPVTSPVHDEEGGMEAVPSFNKKEDPMPLLGRSSSSSGGGVGGGGEGGGRSPRGVCRRADGSTGIPWGVLIRSSAVWAIVTSNFAFHYATYVLMNWLPTYFRDHIGVGLSDMSSWYTVSCRPRPQRTRPGPFFSGGVGWKNTQEVFVGNACCSFREPGAVHYTSIS